MAKEKFQFTTEKTVQVKAVNRYQQLQSSGFSIAQAAKIVVAELIADGEESLFDVNLMNTYLISNGNSVDDTLQIISMVNHYLTQQCPTAKDIFRAPPEPPSFPPPELLGVEFATAPAPQEGRGDNNLLVVEDIGVLMDEEGYRAANPMIANLVGFSKLHPMGI